MSTTNAIIGAASVLLLLGAIWLAVALRRNPQRRPRPAGSATVVHVTAGDLPPGAWRFADGILERDQRGPPGPQQVLLKHQLQSIDVLSEEVRTRKGRPIARGAGGFLLAGPIGATIGIFTAKEKCLGTTATFRAKLHDGRQFIAQAPVSLMPALHAAVMSANTLYGKAVERSQS